MEVNWPSIYPIGLSSNLHSRLEDVKLTSNWIVHFVDYVLSIGSSGAIFG
jgi:hypothetical protein